MANESPVFDSIVTRVTPSKPAGLVKLCELRAGDEFTWHEKRYKFQLMRGRFEDVNENTPVLRHGMWFVVCKWGRENVLWPLTDPNNPFSKPVGMMTSNDFPFPEQVVKALVVSEIVDETSALLNTATK